MTARGAARDAQRWRQLVRVRGVRLRRRLLALADARRRERAAAGEMAARDAALQAHAAQRLQVLALCRPAHHAQHSQHDQDGRDAAHDHDNWRVGSRWRATLRAHDERLRELQRQRDDAKRTHAAARDDAERMLRDWRVERIGYDEAVRRWRLAVRAASA